MSPSPSPSAERARMLYLYTLRPLLSVVCATSSTEAAETRSGRNHLPKQSSQSKLVYRASTR